MKNLKSNNTKQHNSGRRRNNRRHGQTSENQINELLKICLQKICDLQAEINRNEETEEDPEAAGYAACALETLQFLSAEGLSPNHPMVKKLQEHLTNGTR